MIASIIVGLVTSGVVACVFYRLGRSDTESAYRRFILTWVDMRLRQTDPTRRERTPEHYDLKDTEHWLTCLAEVLTEIGFTEEAAVTKIVLGEIKDSPHVSEQSEQTYSDGEAKKIKWYAYIHKRIEELK